MNPSPSKLFGAIGEKNRLRILRFLMDEPKNVSEIQKFTGLEKTLLSKHLKQLRSVGLVLTKKVGRNLIYKIAPEHISTSQKYSLTLDCCEIKLKSI